MILGWIGAGFFVCFETTASESFPVYTGKNAIYRVSSEDIRPLKWAEIIDTEKNLYRIQSNLYRGKQPGSQDVVLLKALNIKTIINFRAFHNDKKIFSDTKIHLIDIPIHTWDINDAHVIEALSAIQRSLTRGGVLIHCQHGADRTGLISAMYRIVFQGWSKSDALSELTDGGFGYHSIWRNIPKYILNADIEKIKQAIQSSTGQTAI